MALSLKKLNVSSILYMDTIIVLLILIFILQNYTAGFLCMFLYLKKQT